jgi:hypothetical protein
MQDIIGKVLNQIENVITIEIDSNYQFTEYEKVGLLTLKDTFDDDLRALYWILLEYVIENNYQFNLPNTEKWFKKGEHKQLSKNKLYTLVRYQTDWIEVSYDKDGNKRISAKSTGRSDMTQNQRSDHYDAVYNFLSKYIPMDEFIKQHEKARRELGKE